MKWMDAHAHLRLGPGEVERLLAMMDRCGIESTVVIAGGTITPELLSIHYTRGGTLDVDVDNAGVLAACQRSHGRLLPFYFANPLRGAAPYIEAAADFHGLKLAPIVHGVPFSDPRVRDLVAAAAEFQHPTYLHCLPHAGFGVSDVIDLAKAIPDAQIILGHGGLGHADFHGISLIAKQPNIYFETSGSFSASTRFAWQTLGADRVLFGSEYPLQDPRVELTKMEALELPADDYRRIMGDNMRGLLALGQESQCRSESGCRVPSL